MPKYIIEIETDIPFTRSSVKDAVRALLPHPITKPSPEGWISVKDRLPEVEDGSDAVKVLVYYNCAISHTMKIGATYFWKDSLSLSENGLPGGFELLGVTHWMPLPEPPEAV
jgi:hypothetical protein